MKLILGILALFIFPSTFGQYHWQLVKNKNGLKIYTANQENTRVKAIKVEADLKGNLDKLESVLRNPAACKTWVFNTKTANLIQSISVNSIVGYMDSSFPWPASNRDVTVVTTLSKTNGIMRVLSRDTALVPVQKNIVRITDFYNTWNISKRGDNNLHIDYFLTFDLGGSLPAWIVNAFITKGPYESFLKLSELIQ